MIIQSQARPARIRAHALGASLLALGLCAPAHAQDTSPAEDEAIVVTGIRSSLDSALGIKRNADQVVDAISAEDVGRYPDINIAESAQRISGVQIVRTRGEGQTVNIRGLPAVFTLATLNGRTVASALTNTDAAASRAFDFSILPSEFVRSLEVYKSPTADLEEGGLSGTVNIRTPRALELGKRVLTGSAQVEYHDKSGKAAPRAAFLFADSFADDRLGVTFGLSYSKRRPQTDTALLSYFYQREGAALGSGTQAADLNGNGVIEPAVGVRIPGNLNFALFDEKRERISGIGAIEFRPSDSLTLYVEGLYSKLDIQAVRSENNWFLANSRGLISSSLIADPGDGTATIRQISLAQVDVRANGRVEDRPGRLLTTTAGGSWQQDRLAIEFSASRSESKQTLSNLAVATTTLGSGTFETEVGAALPSVGFTGTSSAALTDPNAYRVVAVNGQFGVRSRDRLTDARIDVKRDLGEEGLTRLAIGGRYAHRKQYQGNDRIVLLPAAVSQLYGGLPAGSLPGSFSAAPLMHLVRSGRGSFLGAYSGSAVFPRELLVSNPDAFILAKSEAELRAAGTYTNDPTGITDVTEETIAGYARADIRTGRLSGNIGLRVVHTRQASVGVSPDLAGITLDLRAGADTRVPPAQPVTIRRAYTEFLPSLNLRYEASDSLQLRFALSRTIARPNLADIAPTTTANGLVLTITEKNPYLEPFRANNADLAVEWYFARGAVLGVSAFYKDLRSLIQNVTSVDSIPVQVINLDGTTSNTHLNFTVNRLVNGKGVKLKGFELFYQQAFTSLPAPFDGLGVAANYTFIDNSDPRALTAASRHNFNLTGYYERGPVAVRLSYAWRGSYLSTPPQVSNMGVRAEAFGTLDGSASLQVTKQVALSLEAVNLLGTPQVSRYLQGLPNSYVDTGRRLLAGARFSF